MRSIRLNSAVVALSLSSLLACEGEPPKVPQGASVVQSKVASERAAPADHAEMAEAPAPRPVPPAAPCPSAPSSAPAAADAIDAGAPAPLAVAPPAPSRLNITGTVASTPATLAKNAVVYLVDAPIEPDDKHKKLTVTNTKMTFYPYVGVVTQGGKVTFYNDDPFPHNVFSHDNEKFDMGNVGAKSAVVRTFSKSGAYGLLCNLHPNMLGYVFVSPSSYFAKVDSKGQFSIPNVPTGTYKIAVWAPRAEGTEQSVSLTTTDATVSLEIKRK